MGIFDYFTKATLDIDGIFEVLDSLELTINQIKTEKNAERLISEHLSKHFGDVFTQYNVGGYLGLKIDIDIGNGEFGIELKLASSIKKSVEAQRLLGQTIYYKKRRYDEENLLIIIIGDEKNSNNQVIKEISEFISEEIGVYVYYLTAVNKRTK